MTVRQRGGFLRGGAASLAACGVLATGMSFLGSHGFFFELLSHFRVHLAGGTVLLMLVAAAARHWTAAVAAALAAAANVIPLLPYAASPAADVRSGTPVRVMAANLHGPFVDRDAVELLVERERPDVVVLTEVDPSFAKSLAKMAAWLPHRVDGQAGSIFETFVLSRWPIAVRASERAVPWAPVNAYRICPNPAEPLGCFDLVASHPPPPVQPNAMRLRDRTLQAAAWLARESSARWQILAGDRMVAGLRGRAPIVGLARCQPRAWAAPHMADDAAKLARHPDRPHPCQRQHPRRCVSRRPARRFGPSSGDR